MFSTLSAIAREIDWERVGLAVLDVAAAIVGAIF